MPIYAYKCASCGFAKDVLQKISDQPLSTCPSCGASTFQKQVTAASFQLKGSGWYVTDFRDGGAGKPASTDAGAQDGGKPTSDAAPAPAAAPSPAPAPDSGSSSGGT